MNRNLTFLTLCGTAALGTASCSEHEDLSGRFPERMAYMDSLMRASHVPSVSFPFPGDF